MRVALMGLVALGCMGCAHRPPAELLQARAAYAQAQGLACEQDPASVYLAGKSLQRAERAFELKDDDTRVRHLAYVATRKAERVAVLARAAQNEAKLAALTSAKEPVAAIPRPAAPEQLADNRP